VGWLAATGDAHRAAGQPSGSSVVRAIGGKAIRGKRINQLVDSSLEIRFIDYVSVATFKFADPLTGEGLNGLLTPGLSQESQNSDGQVVVRSFERITTALAQ